MGACKSCVKQGNVDLGDDPKLNSNKEEDPNIKITTKENEVEENPVNEKKAEMEQDIQFEERGLTNTIANNNEETQPVKAKAEEEELVVKEDSKPKKVIPPIDPGIITTKPRLLY